MIKCILRAIVLVACSVPAISYAASMGPGVPTRLTPEGNVLHVHMDGAPKSGLPSCARRVYIDLTTEAGRAHASVAIAAFMGGKKVTFILADNIGHCNWGSSVPHEKHFYVDN
ncbi:hypothetical protein [Vibrio penaeicida]|uniref:Uncharacterized protein n=1 Tax=Vibrio penaeicida TaxID=104609 RepID=A0AAV5NSG7_9VIBR|nr:hypothetical protein [Vibrio penaeicida]RTZ23738.1 hypothetical protein EKN09_07310 [Vibrio penaeicida]GLQ72947.1 hypothetical protein GCM10007932_23070 [Vibrio penaeicida]